MVRIKEFKTLDEQIDILCSRGLIISDIDKTKDILFRENYFFIQGYRHLFLQSPPSRTFIKGTKFEEVYALFVFDRFFRNIVFKNLLIVENNLKSIFSYKLSKKYGYKERDYLNPKNFTSEYKDIRRVKDVIDKIRRQERLNGKEHTATLHYLENYGYVPLWILVKVLSFGLIGELYGILKTEDKISIAEEYYIDYQSLEIFIPILANYRNLCAHEDILFEHKTERKIPDNKYHHKLGIDKDIEGQYIYGKNDIFSVVLMLRYLLTELQFRMMMKEIEYELILLDGKINSISIEKILDSMGFPANYMDLIDIK